MESNAIDVVHLSKAFRVYHERNAYLKTALLRGRRARYDEFNAVNDVSFSVAHGSTFGIIGANGSGKSTLLKCIAGVLSPDSGRATTSGRTAALLELGSGFHPDLSGRENVYLNGALLGLSQKEIKKRFDEIVDFAGIEEFIDTPVKNYSSGMSVRLGFAIAVSVDPDLLIIDEVLAVGDAAFQTKCYRKIESFRRSGKTILFVSHGLSDVTMLCNEVLWMEKGRARAIGRSVEVVGQYLGVSHNDPHKTSETNSERWGTGEVEITQVETLGSTDELRSTFTSGEDVTIRVHYESKQPVHDVIMGFRISHIHGAQVFGTNSKRRNHLLDLKKQFGSVDIVLPHIKLLPGTYEVTLDLADSSETNTFDHRGRCISFEITHGDYLDEGLVRLDVDWRQ